MLTLQAALDLVHHHLGATPRARHSIFVGSVMHHLAEPQMADATLWEITGLCHDLDFEATRADPSQHGLLAAHWLEGQLPEPALLAIRAHDHRSGITADTPIATALKLADALAVITEALADRTTTMLADPNAAALLTTEFATRPWLPAMLLDHARRLGITMPTLARICAMAPPMLSLAPVTPEHPTFPALLAQSLAEGHRMLFRFEAAWRAGTNRFDRPGELILGASTNGLLLGLCGRNIDPYDPTPRAGRVRHLYVAPDHRHAGIGRLLLDAIRADAGHYFAYLNTNAPATAFAFYQRLGFVPLPNTLHVTHRLQLTGTTPSQTTSQASLPLVGRE